MNVFVGHSFSKQLPLSYYEKVKKIYRYFFQNNHKIYIGGLLSILEKELNLYGENIICYSIDSYKAEKEYCKTCTYVLVENSIVRTEKLIKSTDYQIFLAGGTGTFSEILQAIEYNRSLNNRKPVLLFDEENYFETFLQNIEELIKNGYNVEDTKHYFCVIHSLEELDKVMKEGI